MAGSLLFLLSFAATLITAASLKQVNISLSDSLTPITKPSWLSPSGIFAFGFYQRGEGYSVGVFLPGTPRKTVVWTATRDSPPFLSNSTLRFTADGRLVLQSTDSGHAPETSIASPDEAATSASMLDTGNFVLYNSMQKIVWQSFSSPTDTLLAGQHLSPRQEMFSSASDVNQSTGIFRLRMQRDGNLVQYPVNTLNAPPYAYWSTSTGEIGDNVTLYLDNDAHLYLMNISSGVYIKNITGGGRPKEGMVYRLRIDPDGILRLYSYNLTANGDWFVEWASSADKCSPKGLCGLNGFCVQMDQSAKCLCLPGFAPVSEGNWASGCERNFTVQSCKKKDEVIEYTMQTLANTEWDQETSYSNQSFQTAEECQASCLQDCICEAVIYEGGSCRKQMLPLRYGRRSSGVSNTLFIKVSESSGSVLKETKKHTRKDILTASALTFALGLIMLVASGVLVWRHRNWVHEGLPKDRVSTAIEDITVAPRSFTYDELRNVTRDFAEEIGKGAFARVFKGTLPDSLKLVAVKKLESISSDREGSVLQTEVKTIGRTHHRNLVKLLGYCLDGSNRLLVYEYMSNGSLADLLYTPEKQPYWDQKIGIARDIARGLVYLHEECETQIIHCDIKPQNILIDDYGHAKISDFGISKLLKPGQTNTKTRIRGTRGYVAPEWHRNQRVTAKADVYSFGIVMLEIICCRRSLDWNLPDEEAVLEEWVYDCFKAGELEKLVEDEHVDRRELEKMVKVGLWCILGEPSLRPTMRKVLLMLEGTVDVPIPPCPTSFLSSM